jgi:ADP-ribose pyrophosphatase
VETWINSEEKYKGKILSLYVGDVRLENGGTAYREVVWHNGGVAIVPVIDDTVILVRQYRIAIGRDILELPAGKLEPGETPEACAHRELAEEIGYQSAEMKFATAYYSSVGYTNERMHIYLAFQLSKVPRHLDPDESIQIVPIPLAEVAPRLANKEFEDAKTIVGLRELLVYFNK